MLKQQLANAGCVAWNNSKQSRCYFATAQLPTEERSLL